MASKDKDIEKDDSLADVSSIQQLIYALGRLKFSLRSIADMSLQVSLLRSEENESPAGEIKYAESNRLLDKVLHEVLSKKNEETKEESNNKTDIKTEKYITSIDELELVNEKLHGEYEKMRLHCLNVLTGLGEK